MLCYGICTCMYMLFFKVYTYVYVLVMRRMRDMYISVQDCVHIHANLFIFHGEMKKKRKKGRNIIDPKIHLSWESLLQARWWTYVKILQYIFVTSQSNRYRRYCKAIDQVYILSGRFLACCWNCHGISSGWDPFLQILLWFVALLLYFFFGILFDFLIRAAHLKEIRCEKWMSFM